MSTEKYRYSETEVAAIFKQATEAQDAAQRRMSNSEGLTLAELQQIGNEVGITPEFIARAAATVHQGEPTPLPVKYLGLPISVARTVELAGPMSDEEWDRLVVDLRETFHARGTVRRDGSLREWRNGNLYALVESTDLGHRLRLGTLKGNARGALTMGLAAAVVGLIFLFILVSSGKPFMEPDALLMALFAVAGLGGIGFTRYGLSRWASEREGQLEAIAARAVERSTTRSVANVSDESHSPSHDHVDLMGGIADSATDYSDAARDVRRDRTRT